MNELILSPVKLLNALKEVLALGFNEKEIQIVGEGLGSNKNFSDKSDRLFFELTGEVEVLLSKASPKGRVFSYQGEGQILWYANSFEEANFSTLRLNESGINAKSLMGHEIQVSIASHFSMKIAHEMEFRAWEIILPFSFYAEIVETKRSLDSYVKDFGFVLENREEL